MLTKNDTLKNISELKSFDGNRKYKARRNYRYYNATRATSIENIRNPMIVGYYEANIELGEEEDTSATPQLNVVASCIDTLHSKIAQSKVRPFFTTINGTFKDIQCVKQAQQFFDVYFDEQYVNKKISDAFKDACIFDTGVLYIDPEELTVNRVLPFQVYVRPAEVHYNKITRVFYEQKDYPVTLLPEKVRAKFRNKSLEYVDYGIYYDTLNKTKAYTANSTIIMTEAYDRDAIPFVFIYYKNPVLGNVTTSVADQLISIQQEINILMAKIKDASQLNAALTFFMPEGSSMKVTQLNNRVGNVLTYKPLAQGGLPVTSSTPAFIDNQYIALLDNLIQKAYDMVGISQLSAQSKKPTGLDSGVALSTMEDVESDRFETQLNQVIRAYIDVAKTCIKVFPQDENILPEIATRTSIRWKDIIKESNNMNIQYSGADNLSKDPSTKLQQLQQLAMAGVIPAARISQLMQIPDLESGYSLSNNAIDAVMTVIKECIEDDVFDVPEYVPFELLKEEIINTQLALYAGNKKENSKDIKKLERLYESVEDMEKDWSDQANAQAEAREAEQVANMGKEQSLPFNQNVLESEANMTPVNPSAPSPSAASVPETQIEPQSNATDNGSWMSQEDYNRV